VTSTKGKSNQCIQSKKKLQHPFSTKVFYVHYRTAVFRHYCTTTANQIVDIMTTNANLDIENIRFQPSTLVEYVLETVPHNTLSRYNFVNTVLTYKLQQMSKFCEYISYYAQHVGSVVCAKRRCIQENSQKKTFV